MKGGVINDIICYCNDYDKFRRYICWIYSNAYRILSQPHSLMNGVR